MPVVAFRLKPAGRAGVTLYDITVPPELAGLLGVICTPLV
jgi:hypothetical protein